MEGRRAQARICVVLRALDAGGAPRTWIELLARRVRAGARATLVAAAGPLTGAATAAGLDVVTVDWERQPPRADDVARLVDGHDAAVVLWDPVAIHAFAPALAACGTAALSLQSRPRRLVDWFAPDAHAAALATARDAAAAEGATVLVCGAAHRVEAAADLGLSADGLDILPPGIPLERMPFRPANGAPDEVLALVRFSPEKASVVRLAVALVRARRAAGHPCRLALAGDGPWRAEAFALCERELAPADWSWERPPADPEARLARADLVVAQGVTTLEAAALGRRVVVARAVDDDRDAAGAVLTPAGYDDAARDPFGRPPLTQDPERLWADALSLAPDDLAELRALVGRHNSVAASDAALREVLA